MNEERKSTIEDLLSIELGDMSWVMGKIRENYESLKGIEEYDEIVKALDIIDEQANKLYHMAKSSD